LPQQCGLINNLQSGPAQGAESKGKFTSEKRTSSESIISVSCDLITIKLVLPTLIFGGSTMHFVILNGMENRTTKKKVPLQN
jgi:hypothetical protein